MPKASHPGEHLRMEAMTEAMKTVAGHPQDMDVQDRDPQTEVGTRETRLVADVTEVTMVVILPHVGAMMIVATTPEEGTTIASVVPRNATAKAQLHQTNCPRWTNG
jgi:hypothetical protein